MESTLFSTKSTRDGTPSSWEWPTDFCSHLVRRSSHADSPLNFFWIESILSAGHKCLLVLVECAALSICRKASGLRSWPMSQACLQATHYSVQTLYMTTLCNGDGVALWGWPPLIKACNEWWYRVHICMCGVVPLRKLHCHCAVMGLWSERGREWGREGGYSVPGMTYGFLLTFANYWCWAHH